MLQKHVMKSENCNICFTTIGYKNLLEFLQHHLCCDTSMVNPRNPQSVVPTHPSPSDQHILQEATYGSKEKKRHKNFGHHSSRTSDHSKLKI
jgi:hypothetical protein